MNIFQVEKMIKKMKDSNNNNFADFLKEFEHYAEAERNQFELNHITMRPESYIRGLQEFCEEFPKEWEIIEIGVYAGESTRIFSDHFSKVYSIDPWTLVSEHLQSDTVELYTKGLRGAEVAFDELCEERKNIFKMKGFYEQYLDYFKDESLDIVYIDGDHRPEAERKSIEDWYTKVKRGGIISGHDYYEGTPGVIKAVDEIFGGPVKVFEDYSWYLIKK
jgi:predicted O-methyltransferase YrrM